MKTAWILRLVLLIQGSWSVSLVLAASPEELRLLPYPKEIEFQSGTLPLGPAEYLGAESIRNGAGRSTVARQLPSA